MNFIKILLLILIASLFLGAVYFLTLLGPKSMPEDMGYAEVDTRLPIEYLKESELLESQFEEGVAAGVLSDENIAKLRKAVALHEKYMEKSRLVDRVPHERLLRLQKRLQNVESKPIYERIIELEKRAEKESDSGSLTKAIADYKQAYELQAGINSDYSLSDYRDLRRLAAYDRAVKMLEARPLYTKSLKHEDDARNAYEKGDWKTAQNEFELAVTSMREMLEQFPTSVYSDFARFKTLESDLDSLKSRALEESIAKFIKEAEESEQNNDFMKAAEHYADASEYQKKLNKLFPKSASASEEKVKSLESKRNEAFSWKSGSEIVEQRKALNKALYDGNESMAAEICANLLRKSEKFKKDYPQNKIVDDVSILSLRYINYIYRDIPKIRKLVFGNLNTIDGENGVKMLKTEVTQELFELVVQENPSRSAKGKNYPVDSVSVNDALRFCSRLSLILSRNVSIPTEKMYRSAIGSLKYVNLDEIAWNHGNSGGVTHPVAQKKSNDRGYYDLLGNVSEFMKSEKSLSEGDGISIIGGGAQTSPDAMLDLAKSNISENQRNRMVGFRITVSESIVK